MTRWSLPRERAEISWADVILNKSPRSGAGRCWSVSPANQQGGWSRLHHRDGLTKGSEPSWQPSEARSRAGTRQRSASTTPAKHSNWWLLGDFPSLGSAANLAAAGTLPGPPSTHGQRRSDAVTASLARAEGLSLLQCNPRNGQRGRQPGKAHSSSSKMGTSPKTHPCPQHPANSRGNLGTHCSRRTHSPRGPPLPQALGTWPAARRASCHTPRKAGPRPRPLHGGPRRG